MRLDLDKIKDVLVTAAGADRAEGLCNIFIDIGSGRIPKEMGVGLIDRIVDQYGIAGEGRTYLESLKSTILSR